MIKLIKRGFALMLVLAMCLTAAACNKGGAGGTSGNTNTTGNIDLSEYTLDSDALLATMPEELKGTKLELVIWYDTDEHEEKAIIEQFEQKTGIEVSTRVVEYGSYVSTLAGLLTVGETPDVARMKNPNMGVIKLMQPLSVTGFDFSDKVWDQGLMNTYTFGENVYGTCLRFTPYHLPGIIVYNKDTMEEMGFENPWELWKQGKWTWEKLEEMCTTWVNQGTEYTGACIWPFDAAANALGGASFIKYDDEGMASLDITNENALKAWKFIEDGVLTKLYTNLNDGFDQANQKLLFGGMTASVVQGRTTDYFTKTRLRGQIEFVMHPKWEGQTEEYYSSVYEINAFGIPKGAKNPKAVPYFLAYLTNLANYDLGIYDEETCPEGFFYSQQAKDFYLDALAVEHRSSDISHGASVYYLDPEAAGLGWMLAFRVDSTQLQSWLAQNEYVFQASLDAWNADAKTLAGK